MEFNWFLNLALLFLLLFLSAFFSGSEVALFSLDRKKISGSNLKSNIVSRYLNNLISFPRRLLVTILVGNTIVNVAVSIIAVVISIEIAKIYNINLSIVLTAQILVTTFLVLIFGELLPKILASRNPLKFSRLISVPLYLFSMIIFPIAEFITEIIRLSSSKIKFNLNKSALTKDEIGELTALSKEKGAIEDDEHELISSIVELRDLTIAEIMTPRVDVIAVSVEQSIDEIITVISQSGHSRIPLFRNNLDEISGIIYAKDLLKYIREQGKTKQILISSLARKALYVPESKKISDLLQEFQEKKVHIAIAVDEYGGTAGLITLEDIIEEVVGEIWDEFDKEEKSILEIDEGKFLVLGKTPISILNDEVETEIDIENEEFDTVAGLIMSRAGVIPKEGFNFIDKKFKYTVKELHKKRIKKVLVEKVS